MRKIKFRAWITDEGYGSCKEVPFMCAEMSFEEYMPINDEISQLQANGNKLMQYTGLKDKNGREIYESDICYDDHLDVRGKVVYAEGVFLYEWENVAERLFEVTRDIEVIGNIHENPELLGEGRI